MSGGVGYNNNNIIVMINVVDGDAHQGRLDVVAAENQWTLSLPLFECGRASS